MTIKEAAIEVLKDSKSPLSLEEIQAGILERELYTFGKEKPRSPILRMLKRHSEGAHSCSPAKTKTFRLVKGDRYELINEDRRAPV